MRLVDHSKKILFQNKRTGIFVAVNKKSIREENKEIFVGCMAKQHPVTKKWFEKKEKEIFQSCEFERISPNIFDDK